MSIDRKAFRSLSCGLYVVSALSEDGTKCGCIVNTVLQVSSAPDQLIVSINKKNVTSSAVENCKRFCASVLSTEADMDLIGTFGFKSSKDIDKFENYAHECTSDGLPYLTACSLASFEVKIDTIVDVQSHYVFIGRVENAQVLAEGEPLTYAYYHKVLKGKTPKNAASYNGGDDSIDQAPGGAPEPGSTGGNVGWRCRICGHIIEGYPDGLPADFTCPICGMPGSSFERVEI